MTRFVNALAHVNSRTLFLSLALLLVALPANNLAVQSVTRSPSATGDDYTDFSTPANAYTSNNQYAREAINNQDQDWFNFAFGIPAGAVIDGIEVRIEASDEDWSGNGADVDLSWDGGASYTSTGYGFMYNNDTDVVSTHGGSTNGWGRTWSDGELSDANFRLRLTKTGNNFTWVRVDHIEITVYYTGDATPPDTITDLATGTLTSSSVDLSWTAPGDDGATGTVTTYDIRYSTSTITAGNWASATQATGEPSPQVAGSSESFTVTGLSASTTYYFAIKTSNEIPNESALSNVPSASTTEATPPDAITDLATGTLTSSSVDLSWTAPGDDGATGTATTYDIRYSTSLITAGNWASATQVTGEPSPQVAGSSESFTVTGLSGSTTYYFAIKTSDEVPNESAISNIPSATTAADTTPPDAVTDLATGTVTSSSVALSWTAPGDDGATGTATTYNLRYSTSPITVGNWASATPATGEPSPQAAGSAESFTVTGLGTATTYYFAIKTSDEVPNESALSNVPSATTTVDGTPPDAVTDLAAGPVTSTTVDLSWTAPGDDGATGTATTYDIRYSTSAITAGNWASATQVTGEPTPSVAGSAESFTVTGLTEGITYYFAIKTSDEISNESPLSNVPSATTADTTPPDAIADLATGTVTSSSVDLSWIAPGDDGATGTATTYDVRYSTSTITVGNWASATQATGEPAPQVAGSAESFNVTGLSASTLYYFAIKTSDEVPNESALSNVPSVTSYSAACFGTPGGAPVRYEGGAEAKASSSVTSIDVPIPCGTSNGDLLVVAVATDGNQSSSMAPPGGEGWTPIDVGAYSTNVTLGVWWKLAGVSESPSHQFTWSGGERAYAWMMRFTGHHTVAPIHAVAAAGQGSTSTPTSPSVTTLVNSTLIVRMGAFDDDDVTVDSPGLSGHTAITMDESNSGDGTASGGAGYVDQPTAGSSGTSTFSLTNSEQSRMVTIAIRPETYAVAVTPATTAVSRLPSNGTNYTVDFTVVNGGSATDDFDLLTTQSPGTAIAVVSITGTGVTQAADPDSARVSGVAAGDTAIMTVTYSVADVAAGTADTLFFPARSVANPATTDNGRLELTVIRPNLTTGKAVNPSGTQLPGTDLTYTVTITNDGNDDATGVVVVDSLAVELDFKVGSVVNNLPSGVSATVEYSDDAGSTWTYVPVSAGCGAPATFDSCVTHIRWTLQNDLSYVGPDNTGNVEFVARIQ